MVLAFLGLGHISCAVDVTGQLRVPVGTKSWGGAWMCFQV